ncbi:MULTISPECIES: PH domain-containing protein [unclassified Roseiflexus]|jgi:Bacterial membrane flanked domain.|uniref:PH domain-containing protein n=1 Tax=unclassified Roseiflexus TaxID=2609473 RepID=UPI0000D80EAC|nr:MULTISPECIES: PH domain-containing protein [unclassified Roseiflexus]ABQ92052.1 membrane-flanked domain [Roseiflexus sp. RS-1]MBO9323136.1 PH domain-containing protein [Roseiflexus sp.]MBO9341831.1 PH domain-containing protein [Roseiflexus sp.]MCL6543054.1 PH domain-containing protein [Roseiflexus sp.]
MTLEQNRARVVAAVWQAIAQSGVDLSSVPRDQQDRLVAAIADTLLPTVNQMLDEVAPRVSAEVSGEERVLWEGRPFLSITERYVLTTERVRIYRGLIGRNIDDIELVRLQDIDFTQNAGERIFGIGDIHLRGADPSTPEVTLRNVHQPEEVRELIRRAWLDARKRYGVSFREQM